MLVVLVHRIGIHLAARFSLRGVDHLDVLIEVDVFGIGRLLGTRRKDGLERSEGLGVERVGELDREVHNQVAHLVVAVGRHSLAGDDLDGTCEAIDKKVSKIQRGRSERDGRARRERWEGEEREKREDTKRAETYRA